MLFKKSLKAGAVIAMAFAAMTSAYVGTTTTPVPNRVSASLSSWLSIAPGADASQLNFSWATLGNNNSSITYHPIFQADTQIAYSVQAPAVQIVKIDNDGDAATVDFNGNPNAQTFYGISLKAHATVSNKDTVAGWFQNKVTVSGLQNSSIYAYRVGYGSTWSGVNTVRTQNPSAFSFIAVGDPQLGSSTGGAHANPQQQANVEVWDSIAWQQSVTTITSAHPDAAFWMSLGDEIENTSNLGTNDREYASYFAPLEMLNVPFANIIGNHDAGLGQYFGYHYNLANQSSQYGVTQNGNDGDYWFTYGNALFIVLNSMTQLIATHDAFIGQAIAANPNAKWRIVSFHHALFSTADHPFDADILFRRGTWTSVFDKYAIDVVLSGHDHCYMRSYQIKNAGAVSKELMAVNSDSSVTVTDPQGTLYMELNAGSGDKYYDLNAYGKYPIDSATGAVIYPAYCAKTWQGYQPTFSRVSIDANSFNIATYTTGDLVHPIDNYTIVKHDQPSAAVALTANGSTGSVTLAPNQVLNLSAGVLAHNWSGIPCDYWIYADAPNGIRFFYHASTSSWDKYSAPSFQGPVNDIANRPLYASPIGLGAGVYTFHFIIDNVMNGAFDGVQVRNSITVIQN